MCGYRDCLRRPWTDVPAILERYENLLDPTIRKPFGSKIKISIRYKNLLDAKDTKTFQISKDTIRNPFGTKLNQRYENLLYPKDIYLSYEQVRFTISAPFTTATAVQLQLLSTNIAKAEDSTSRTEVIHRAGRR